MESTENNDLVGGGDPNDIFFKATMELPVMLTRPSIVCHFVDLQPVENILTVKLDDAVRSYGHLVE